MSPEVRHIPVLLHEVITLLDPQPTGGSAKPRRERRAAHLIDATINGGGHARVLLEATSPGGKLLGIDADPGQIARAKVALAPYVREKRLTLVRGNFANIQEYAHRHRIKPIHGILFDLGVSSYHFEGSGRGFSFKRDEPLDMRFDPGGIHPSSLPPSRKASEGRGKLWSHADKVYGDGAWTSRRTKLDEMESTLFGGGFRRGSEEGGLHLGSPAFPDFVPARIYPTAEALVNSASVQELTRIFRLYGEERYAARIAEAISARRAHRPLRTTIDLVRVIESAMPAHARRGRIHPATRVFQAIRIAVNQELVLLAAALPSAFHLLARGGRLAVISFHSLEDRIVKHFFQYCIRQGMARSLTPKPVRPSRQERIRNPRSRSALLRVIEKI